MHYAKQIEVFTLWPDHSECVATIYPPYRWVPVYGPRRWWRLFRRPKPTWRIVDKTTAWQAAYRAACRIAIRELLHTSCPVVIWEMTREDDGSDVGRLLWEGRWL